MSKKIKRTFKMSVRILNAKQRFGDDFEPGVIATQEMTYTATKEEFSSPMFIKALVEAQEEFMKEHVQVSVEEVK